MLYEFMLHPLWWAVPALAMLATWMLAARVVPVRWFKPNQDGDTDPLITMLYEPALIVCGSALWFIFVPFAVFGGTLWLLAKGVGILVGRRL